MIPPPNRMRYTVLGRRTKPDGSVEKFCTPPEGHFQTLASADRVCANLVPQFPTWTFIIEQTLSPSLH